jgi:NTP pyrophosphatase (non-canonical NTP hydrolase)
MEFLSYQNQAKRTAIYPSSKSIIGLMYVTLGLTGEAGEIANDVKKTVRDDAGVLSETRQQQIINELGDVLWYMAMMCYELDTTLETIAIRNLAKLRKRQHENTLHDSGERNE